MKSKIQTVCLPTMITAGWILSNERPATTRSKREAAPAMLTCTGPPGLDGPQQHLHLTSSQRDLLASHSSTSGSRAESEGRGLVFLTHFRGFGTTTAAAAAAAEQLTKSSSHFFFLQIAQQDQRGSKIWRMNQSSGADNKEPRYDTRERHKPSQ